MLKLNQVEGTKYIAKYPIFSISVSIHLYMYIRATKFAKQKTFDDDIS